jgi:hypothetical protein
MKCLQALLSFGLFDSEKKLHVLTKQCIAILYWKIYRVDNREENTDSENMSSTRIELAKSAIDVLLGVSDLRMSSCLAKLLFNFKQRLPRNSGAVKFKSTSYNYLTGATNEAQKEVRNDFGALLELESDDIGEFDTSDLETCSSIDELLMAALLQPDDKLFSKGLDLYQRINQQRKELLGFAQDVILLPSPEIGVFGNIQSLRVDINKLRFLLSNYSTWGVRSPLSGAFNDDDFSATMSVIDRLLCFLYDDESPSLVNPTLADPRPHVSSNENIDFGNSSSSSQDRLPFWDVDIAATWAPSATEMKGRKVMVKNQDILRSLNLQELLRLAAMGPSKIDTNISYKGSLCSDDEKKESSIRLNLVHRARLRLAAAFTAGNRANQSELASTLPFLEEMIAPHVLKLTSNWKQTIRESSIFSSNRLDTADLVQAVVLSILKRNEPLVEKVGPTLISYSADLANASSDVSTSPELELFFIACVPDGRPVIRLQNLIVQAILHPKRKHFVDSLRDCLNFTLDTEDVDHEVPVENRRNIGHASLIDRNTKESAENGNGSPKVSNHARLLKLLRCLVEGGNENAWQRLTTILGISLEPGFETLVNFVERAGLLSDTSLDLEKQAEREAAVSLKSILHLHTK